ncbi:MAG: plasmid pRiA4b ORF-3 family protein [Psychrilyobacter sp.]|uniref:plasmid pRiA4b ORF-3 family protein n=1 Tax=Psychrilyobacter sp. TaxID=2586924 RepID=UPI003C7622D3
MVKISINDVKTKNKIYQFRVDINGAKPPIWRRIQVEKNICFGEFHYILQNIFSWENYHLHEFCIDRNTLLVDTTYEGYEPLDMSPMFGMKPIKEINEHTVKLNKYFKKVDDKLTYGYDFGDGWEHTIKLEKILDKDQNQNYPYLVTGKRVAPFEDCGGIWGWEDICEVMEGKENDRKEEILEYYPKFDPKDFTKKDIKEINEIFENWNK